MLIAITYNFLNIIIIFLTKWKVLYLRSVARRLLHYYRLWQVQRNRPRYTKVLVHFQLRYLQTESTSSQCNHHNCSYHVHVHHSQMPKRRWNPFHFGPKNDIKMIMMKKEIQKHYASLTPERKCLNFLAIIKKIRNIFEN